MTVTDTPHISRRRLVLYALLTVVVLLGTLELALRQIIPEERLRFAYERHDGPFTVNARAMVQPRPSYSIRATDGPYQWEMQADRWALRESSDTPEIKAPGTRRILALGDSFIYGYSVTQGKTLADHLERLLPPRLGQPIEVLNGGIPGGSAYDMLVYYHQVVSSLAPDDLLLGIPHNVQRQEQAMRLRTAWYEAFRGAPFVDSWIYLVLRRTIAPWMRPKYAPPPAATPSDAQVHDLKAIAHDARARGMRLWVLEWPASWGEGPRGGRPEFVWRDALGPLGARFAGHELAERSCWGFVDRGHPSEAGQHATAQVLARLIETGSSLEQFATEPRCSDVDGLGPGKPPYQRWRDPD